jgi:threonine dehydratase
LTKTSELCAAALTARERIAPYLKETPIASSDSLNDAWKCSAFFKMDMLHTTGSFKERGALNKLLSLSKEDRGRGIAAASAGNHAQAVAFHARRLNIPATIVMPENAPLIKVKNTESFGAKTVLFGACYDDALEHAKQLAEEKDLILIHGFDDLEIMAGQGTIGLELLDQFSGLDCVIVPVGGGGLVSGIAAVIKTVRPAVRIIGVQSANCPSMIDAVAAKKAFRVDATPTIADGIAVRKVGGMCLDIVEQCVDELVTVTEDAIAQAVLVLLEDEKIVAEGAGAVGVAALQQNAISGLDGARVALVLSGGNIDVNRLSRIIDKGLVKDGRLALVRVQVPDVPGELARLLQEVAQARANILEIEHHRAFSNLQVGVTLIDLILECRGHEHVKELMDLLHQHGVNATLRS